MCWNSDILLRLQVGGHLGCLHTGNEASRTGSNPLARLVTPGLRPVLTDLPLAWLPRDARCPSERRAGTYPRLVQKNRWFEDFIARGSLPYDSLSKFLSLLIFLYGYGFIGVLYFSIILGTYLLLFFFYFLFGFAHAHVNTHTHRCTA